MKPKMFSVHLRIQGSADNLECSSQGKRSRDSSAMLETLAITRQLSSFECKSRPETPLYQLSHISEKFVIGFALVELEVANKMVTREGNLL
jgi:hypothetical protein